MKKCTFCNGSGKTPNPLVMFVKQPNKNICKKCNGKGRK